MDPNLAIVFIHGAGLNSSIWDDLINEIAAPTLTIDFPNKNLEEKDIGKLTFEDYVDHTIKQIENWEKDEFIIVAHSIGACIGLKVANHFKKELKGFVAISSIIPLNGNSFVSTLPFPQKLLIPLVLRLFGTKPPEKAIKNELCNDLTDDQSAIIVDGFTPESKALYLTRIHYVLPKVNRLYIKLTNDQSMPIKLQEEMAKNLQAHKVLPINSGHLPMISEPEELAGILSEFIKDVGFGS